jgi:tetratricopeptide (TPR) repeat protein
VELTVGDHLVLSGGEGRILSKEGEPSYEAASLVASNSNRRLSKVYAPLAVEIGEKALGMDHPKLGAWLSNLGGLYLVQGRYAEAEPLFRRSLAIRERALGLEHREVGTSLNNLAEFYRLQGRFTEAEINGIATEARATYLSTRPLAAALA